MTLIIMFEKAPVIIGDLMVSSKADIHPIKIVKKDGTRAYSAFPMQKIVSIHPGVHIACSGNVGDTKKIIEFARGLHWPTIPPGGFNPAEVETHIRPLVDKMGRYYDDEGLGIPGPSRQFPLQIIFYLNGLLFSVRGERLLTPAGPVQVIGSGVEDLQRHLQGPFNHTNKWAFPGQESISFALSFFVQYLTQRASLPNRWGWGMEMLLSGEKKDRILLQAFLWEKPDDKSELRFEQVGDKIFSYYRGDILNILKQRADGQWVARRAGPLTDDGRYTFRPAAADVPSSPQLICTAFISKSDGSVHVHTENEPDDGVCFISLTGSGPDAITYPLEEVSKRFSLIRDPSNWFHADIGVPMPKAGAS